MTEELVDLIGIKYAEGGRDPSNGLDCWGLVRIACQRYGRDLPMDPAVAMATADVLGYELPDNACLELGDLLELDGPPGADLHVGFVINEFYMLHATRERGVCVDRIVTWSRANKVRQRIRLHGATS